MCCINICTRFPTDFTDGEMTETVLWTSPSSSATQLCDLSAGTEMFNKKMAEFTDRCFCAGFVGCVVGVRLFLVA